MNPPSSPINNDLQALVPLPEPNHRRKGKVARLPKCVRDEINQMLIEGISYPDILRGLGQTIAGVNEDNLSNWNSTSVEHEPATFPSRSQGSRTIPRVRTFSSPKHFLPSQLRWIEDDAPLKIFQKSRQVGITYCDAYDSVCKVSPLGARLDVWVSSRDEAQNSTLKIANSGSTALHAMGAIARLNAAQAYSPGSSPGVAAGIGEQPAQGALPTPRRGRRRHTLSTGVAQRYSPRQHNNVVSFSARDKTSATVLRHQAAAQQRRAT